MQPATLRPQLGRAPHRINTSHEIRVDVAYVDGATLSFLFPRSVRISDLNASIRRAGRVQKVTL